MRFYSCSALLMALVFTISGHARLPDLSQEEREANAAYIIEGDVVSIFEEVRNENEGWSDYIYTVQMNVTQALKAAYPPPATFTFSFWRVAERPEGLCGDWGQASAIHAGQRLRVYTYEGSEGGQQLINPNGIDVLPKEPLYVLNFSQ